MVSTSVDVRIHGIQVNKRVKGRSYTVRWVVGGENFSRTYARKALADARRAQLLIAQRKGEAFSRRTGVPPSVASAARTVNWYDFATEFVDQNWKRTSANDRKNVAKALTTVTLALLRAPLPGEFDPVQVRSALREWAFNAVRRPQAHGDIRVILAWVRRNTRSMDAWEDEDTVETVLQALATLLDGQPAAASSALRYRSIANRVVEHAVKRGVLRANPLPKGRGATTVYTTARALDKRHLLSPRQVALLLAWIRERPHAGRCYYAFFATLYYAGLRPEEAVALRVCDVVLPEHGWGEFHVHTARPEVGSNWTDTGDIHEQRRLKGRAEGDSRVVPIHPALVIILRALIETDGLAPADWLFRGQKGGILSGSVFRRTWAKARQAVLEEREYNSPVGKRVYDLRHTCLTTWLNNGVPPAQVAAWAGNSVPVLLAVYARCITGQQEELQQRIEDPQALPVVEPGVAGMDTAQAADAAVAHCVVVPFPPVRRPGPAEPETDAAAVTPPVWAAAGGWHGSQVRESTVGRWVGTSP